MRGAASPALALVQPVARELQPEDELPGLFADEARLEREIAAVRRQINAARSRYGAKHRLLVLPSTHRLRFIFGSH